MFYEKEEEVEEEEEEEEEIEWIANVEWFMKADLPAAQKTHNVAFWCILNCHVRDH